MAQNLQTCTTETGVNKYYGIELSAAIASSKVSKQGKAVVKKQNSGDKSNKVI